VTHLEVQNRFAQNVAIFQHSADDGGIGTQVASVGWGATTVTLGQASEKNWYEARAMGTNQGIASARLGRSSEGHLLRMIVQCG
jgi:hypothetical protein